MSRRPDLRARGGLAAALFAAAVASLVLPVAAAAQGPGTGASRLEVHSMGPFRMEPLESEDYRRGHGDALAIDFSVQHCRGTVGSETGGNCVVEVYGVVPPEGRSFDVVEWSTRPSGPWTSLSATPAEIARVAWGTRLHTGRLYVRARADYALLPARPVDYRSLVRLRLTH